MSQFRVPVLEKYEWQQSVKDKDLATPPVSPAKGDRYIVAASPTGAWASQADNIAWYDGAAWKFDIPLAGTETFVVDELKNYQFISGAWTPTADMKKAVYDTDNDGIVDKAENVDDGAGNASSAAQVKDAVTKAHTSGTETQGGDLSGTVSNATVVTVGGKTAASIATTVDAKPTFDADLKALLFNL